MRTPTCKKESAKLSGNWFRQKESDFSPISALPSSSGGKATRALSDFKYPAVFSSEFSVLPQKTSAYLRASSPSDANTRKIKDLCKQLNIKYLQATNTFPSCNKHHFSMRYCPYQGLKRTMSCPDTDNIRPQNGHYRNAK